MGKCLGILLALLCAKYCMCEVDNGNYMGNMARLLDDLFADYNSNVIPLQGAPLPVSHSISLLRINDFDPYKRIMTVNAWQEMRWTDIRLRWDPDSYGNVTQIRVPIPRIWQPDVVLTTGGPTPPDGSLARVDYSGAIFHASFPTTFTAYCSEPNATNEFECQMKFFSWTYDGNMLALKAKSHSADLSSIVTYDETREILSFTAETSVRHYACCMEPYIDVVYKIRIRQQDVKNTNMRQISGGSRSLRASTTFSQHQADALTLVFNELKNNLTDIEVNLTAASDEWNELKTNISQLKTNQTAASGEWTTLSNRLNTTSDIWNEEMASFKNNVSELDRNVTAASDVWNEEMVSLKANISEIERNLTVATDAWNEAIARHYGKDCSELYATGTVVDGVYTISPDGRCPFQVYCDMTGGGWTLTQKRIDGLVSFNRPWQEYAKGFGNIDGEHWLGLENIHRLTAGGSEIYFHFEYYNGTIGFTHYPAFIVHGATTAYRMNVDKFGYNGTIIMELFSDHNNMSFTTYDRDNDENTGVKNCAQQNYGGGWWYRHCYTFGNLNGLYGRQDLGGIAYHDHGYFGYLKSVTMKVKPSPGYC